MGRRRSSVLVDESMYATLMTVKEPSIWVMMVFLVTLSVFPGLAISIESVSPFCSAVRHGFLTWEWAISLDHFHIHLPPFPPPQTSHSAAWRDTYFVPVYCYVIFNLFDLVGRQLASVIRWPSERNYRQMRFPIYARLLLIVLFIFCNIESLNGVCYELGTWSVCEEDRLPKLSAHLAFLQHPDVVPTAFRSDAFPIVFMIILGATNGYFGTLCMVYGPKCVVWRY